MGRINLKKLPRTLGFNGVDSLPEQPPVNDELNACIIALLENKYKDTTSEKFDEIASLYNIDTDDRKSFFLANAMHVTKSSDESLNEEMVDSVEEDDLFIQWNEVASEVIDLDSDHSSDEVEEETEDESVTLEGNSVALAPNGSLEKLITSSISDKIKEDFEAAVEKSDLIDVEFEETEEKEEVVDTPELELDDTPIEKIDASKEFSIEERLLAIKRIISQVSYVRENIPSMSPYLIVSDLSQCLSVGMDEIGDILYSVKSKDELSLDEVSIALEGMREIRRKYSDIIDIVSVMSIHHSETLIKYSELDKDKVNALTETRLVKVEQYQLLGNPDELQESLGKLPDVIELFQITADNLEQLTNEVNFSEPDTFLSKLKEIELELPEDNAETSTVFNLYDRVKVSIENSPFGVNLTQSSIKPYREDIDSLIGYSKILAGSFVGNLNYDNQDLPKSPMHVAPFTDKEINSLVENIFSLINAETLITDSANEIIRELDTCDSTSDMLEVTVFVDHLLENIVNYIIRTQTMIRFMISLIGLTAKLVDKS